MSGGAAQADCTFAPTAGDDAFSCDSGASAGGLSDLAGSNSLTFPPGGSGVVGGDVIFGAGNDVISMASGAIEGRVDTDGGDDTFTIDAGRVAGAVSQGNGRDSFSMSSGEIASLSQGDSIDEFRMSGGHIIGAFEDGDLARMTDGRIGRVNMKLDNNLFDMSGGQIDGNLVAGFGNDTIILSDGFIGGDISVSGGTDSVTISGGILQGGARLSVGSDRFEWNGGIVYGAVDLGGDDDVALLSDLTDGNLGALPLLAGGTGVDTLTFDHVSAGDVARFAGWESVSIGNDSALRFDAILTLGDPGGTGALALDASSTIFAQGADAGILSADPALPARVTNGGRIQLAGGTVGTRFTIGGDYVGDGGYLLLDAELDDDDSAADRLVVDGGSASGTTGLAVVQAGGAGAQTLRDGILLVEATGGATTTPDAFALMGRVAAGPFEYMLYRGGVSEGTAENWYLRSTLPTPPDPTEPPEPGPGPDPTDPPVAPPEPETPEVAPPPPPPGPDVPEPDKPEPPTVPPPAPEIPTTPPAPGGGAGGNGAPIWRPEVAAYSAAAPAARQLALASLGTFHDRRGDQTLVLDEGRRPATWARLIGQNVRIDRGGDVRPELDGDLWGVQVGLDLFAREGDEGRLDRLGLFVAYATLDANVHGDAVGRTDLAVGSVDAHATSLGATWTRTSPAGWYVDAVLLASWYGGDAKATTGEKIDVDGTAATASIEGGYPFALGARWTIEPQAQLVWSRLDLDDQRDSISSVDYDVDSAVTGRLGFRLEGEIPAAEGRVRPYATVDLWHGFDADATVSFAGTPVVTPLGGTAVELGAGLVAELRDQLNFYGSLAYATDVDDGSSRLFGGSLGVEWRF